jgi:GT2 family glycosyltransferase
MVITSEISARTAFSLAWPALLARSSRNRVSLALGFGVNGIGVNRTGGPPLKSRTIDRMREDTDARAIECPPLNAQGIGKREDPRDPLDRAFMARLRWAWARYIVRRSRIFDVNWYKATYTEVEQQGWDPATHYLAVGAARGLKPNLLFDPDWYLARRPRPATMKNPLLDYISTGARLRIDPSPYFCTNYYLEAIGQPLRQGLSPLGDFASRGAGERIVPTPLFDREWYLRSYPDVLQSGFDPFLHYVSSGDRDGRSPGPWFDASWYRTRNIEVRDSGWAPLRHYLAEGAVHGYDPCGSFATQWYLSHLGDAACNASDALPHYTRSGRQSWRSTHPLLPPPGSRVAHWDDLPWSPPGVKPESSRRALVIVSNAAAWEIHGGRRLIADLAAQSDLDIFLLSWAPLNDVPGGISILDLPDGPASRATIASRVLRALKFRDAAALVIQIGLDPDASPIVDELNSASAGPVADRDLAVPAIVARLPRPLAVRPTVSAIVPNYNHSRYLDERIGSILDQRVMPSEIIVVDDCSTDDSLAVVERWKRASPIPFTVVANDRNSGSTFGQWAKGLALAAFDLVWIAESDDTSSPHFLERLVSYFADDRLALAYTESRVIGADGQWLADSYRFYTESISPQKWLSAYVEEGPAEIDQALAIKNTIPNASAALFRSAVLARHLPSVTTFRYCGDWWAYIRCLEEGRIAYHPEALNAHRQSAGSVTNIGERDTVMLEEALRIKSTLWRSSALSERSRVLGLIQLLIEAGMREDRNIDSGSFADRVIAEFQMATAGRSHLRFQVGIELAPEYWRFADRLVSEAIALEPADRKELLSFCNRVLQRRC